MHNQEFVFKEYRIAPVQDIDIESIRNWRNAQLDILRQKELISKSQQMEYFESKIWDTFKLDRPKNVLFSFFKNGEHIGYGGLVHMSWEDKRAEMSFLVNPLIANNNETYSKSLISFIELMRNVIFDDLKFHRLFTETYAIREFHISVLEKARFMLEGIMRDHVIIDQNFSNSLIHSILNKENV